MTRLCLPCLAIGLAKDGVIEVKNDINDKKTTWLCTRHNQAREAAK